MYNLIEMYWKTPMGMSVAVGMSVALLKWRPTIVRMIKYRGVRAEQVRSGQRRARQGISGHGISGIW